jgi:dTDP-4-dehydrorhamnose reductase
VIYISTDHVFSGDKFLGGGYTEKHKPSPVNNYGHTKLGGEVVSTAGLSDVKIIRTSKLFDRNYVAEFLYNAEHKKVSEFTTVLRRSFLHVQHFVDGLQFVLDNWEEIPTILNISGTDIMTHYMFFCAVARKFDIDLELITPKDRYTKEKAPRPKRCGLNVRMSRTLGVPLYSTHEGIELL